MKSKRLCFGKNGIMTANKIIALHGFLGSPNDFDFLKKDFDIDAPNLLEYVQNDFDILAEKIITEPCHILGYSFGARLGARLKIKYPNMVKKCFLLSGHMGLKTSTERESRVEFENSMIQKLSELSSADFLRFWNGLDLFTFDEPLQGDYHLKDWVSFFEKYGLSKQAYLLDDLLKFKSDIFFGYGKQDLKYKNYANYELNDFFVKFFDGGHRVLRNEEAVVQTLKDNL